MLPWNKTEFLQTGEATQGLLIRSQIIRPSQTFNLRSLALSTQISGRLTENSMLWLFTRVATDGEIQPLSPVCVIQKHIREQRLFCVFGMVTEK